MNKLYVWFPDSRLETVSIRCLFIMRLMRICKLDFDLSYVMLPKARIGELEVEAKEIPLLKHNKKVLRSHEIIQLCKESAKNNSVKITFEDKSFASRILFQWSTTNLLGLYVGLLYGDKEIRQRVYSDYLKSDKSLKEEDLDAISNTMLGWSIHNSDISIEPDQIKEHVFELIDGFDNHLQKSKFWFGEEISICDIALFSFCYMLYNPQMIYFHNHILKKQSLLNWMNRVDKLTRHDHSKIKIGKYNAN